MEELVYYNPEVNELVVFEKHVIFAEGFGGYKQRYEFIENDDYYTFECVYIGKL